MSETDIDVLAKKIAEHMKSTGRICKLPDTVIEDAKEYSKAKREANAGYSDILSAIYLGKGVQTWHVKGLNFFGLLLLVMLVGIVVWLSGLWGFITGK